MSWTLLVSSNSDFHTNHLCFQAKAIFISHCATCVLFLWSFNKHLTAVKDVLQWEAQMSPEQRQINICSCKTNKKHTVRWRERGSTWLYQVNIAVWVTSSRFTQLQKSQQCPSLFEIQLRWQSCVALGLQRTSTLSHGAAHQQPVSARCHTFLSRSCFPSLLSASLFCASAFYNRESTRNQLRGTVCHSPIKSNQLASLRQGLARQSPATHCYVCVCGCLWKVQREKQAPRSLPEWDAQDSKKCSSTAIPSRLVMC